MVLLSASAMARKVFALPSSWLLRACWRRNSFSAASPQSNASRSWLLFIASSCHAAMLSPVWQGARWQRASRRAQLGVRRGRILQQFQYPQTISLGELRTIRFFDHVFGRQQGVAQDEIR